MAENTISRTEKRKLSLEDSFCFFPLEGISPEEIHRQLLEGYFLDLPTVSITVKQVENVKLVEPTTMRVRDCSGHTSSTDMQQERKLGLWKTDRSGVATFLLHWSCSAEHCTALCMQNCDRIKCRLAGCQEVSR